MTSQLNDVITYPMMLVWNMIIQQRVACIVPNPCASFNFPIRYERISSENNCNVISSELILC